jgi:phosphatidyl-myo-inositol dimannoside synthase
MRRPRVMLGADSLQCAANGIARVARLMARVLAEQAAAGRIEAQAVVLSDARVQTDLGLPVRSASGSRARFLYDMHRGALDHSHFVYDFSGIARAHPRLPLLARPYLVFAHGIEIWEQARPDRLRSARRAAVLVANSAYTRARMTALHGGLSHAEICWLATEDDGAPPPRPAQAAPCALILARIDADGGYKGHRELIACWPEVAAAVPGARLLIAGGGPGEARVRGFAQASPARAAIEVLGFVEEPALDALFARASVLAMPSRGEGFGLAYAEAMRRGIPVIASVHDAGREINLDGATGFNVDLDRSETLPGALIRLLGDAALRERCGAAAQARWSEHFTYRGFRARFLPLLERLLDA